MTILLIAGFVLLAFIDLPPLLREKRIKDIIVFGVLFLGAFLASFLMLNGVDLPSVIGGIMYFFKDVLKIPSE